MRSIDDADVILVVGTDPMHAAPILDLRIRKAMRRNGARLGVAGDRPTALDGGAEAVARYAPGGWGRVPRRAQRGDGAGSRRIGRATAPLRDWPRCCPAPSAR